MAEALWGFGRCDGTAWISARAVGPIGWVFGKGQRVGLTVEAETERGGERRTWAAVLVKWLSFVAAGRRPAAGKFSATSREGGDYGHEVSILTAVLDADGR